jgi:hypothetical protein
MAKRKTSKTIEELTLDAPLSDDQKMRLTEAMTKTLLDGTEAAKLLLYHVLSMYTDDMTQQQYFIWFGQGGMSN